MLDFLYNIFVMASVFTSSVLTGLPNYKTDSNVIKKVAITPTPVPVKSVLDSELQKMETEVLSLENELKTLAPAPTSQILSILPLTPTDVEILKPTSKPQATLTLTRSPSSLDTPIKSGDKIGVKSEPTPKPTLKPTSTPTPTPKPINTPTPTPFPIPTIFKQAAPVNGLNANELFSMVNEFRKSYDLPPFKKDESTCEIAQYRAPQVYSEIYGTSAMHSGLRAMQLPYYVNENIINFTTEQHAFNWWINDKIHRDAILSDYNYSCIACHANSCSQIFTSFVPK